MWSAPEEDWASFVADAIDYAERKILVTHSYERFNHRLREVQPPSRQSSGPPCGAAVELIADNTAASCEGRVVSSTGRGRRAELDRSQPPRLPLKAYGLTG
jgi:hypothetical protein